MPTEIGSWADWFSGTASALAVIVALGSFWWSERQRGREGAERRRAAANQVLVKLLTITNSIYVLNKHVMGQVNAGAMAGPGGEGEMWRRVQPMVGFSDEGAIQFEAAELGIFIDARETQFLMDLMLLGRRHSASISAMQEYLVRRDALTKLTPAPVAFNGLVGTVELTPEEYMRIRPYALQVEQLIRTIIAHSEEDWALAQSVSSRFGPIAQRVLGDKQYTTLAIGPRQPKEAPQRSSPAG